MDESTKHILKENLKFLKYQINNGYDIDIINDYIDYTMQFLK